MSDIPIFDMPEDAEQFDEIMDKAFKQVQGSTAYRNDRERPYNGQPHTNNGERGRTLVEGLTMRDIADCIVQGFLQSSLSEELANSVFERSDDPDIGKGTEYASKGTWRHDDIYKIDGAELDPGAVIQNALCMIEHYMGIYPNIPPGSALKIIDELFGDDK